MPIPDAPDAYPEDYSYDEASQTLHVGEGAVRPVDPPVWKFQVSGLNVVASWLGYRMQSRKGRTSSPLDEIRPYSWSAELSRELLQLLWILEHTLESYDVHAELLAQVLEGPMFTADEIAKPPASYRDAPNVKSTNGQPGLWESTS